MLFTMILSRDDRKNVHKEIEVNRNVAQGNKLLDRTEQKHIAIYFRVIVQQRQTAFHTEQQNLGSTEKKCLGSSTGASQRGQTGDGQNIFGTKVVFQGTKTTLKLSRKGV